MDAGNVRMNRVAFSNALFRLFADTTSRWDDDEDEEKWELSPSRCSFVGGAGNGNGSGSGSGRTANGRIGFSFLLFSELAFPELLAFVAATIDFKSSISFCCCATKRSNRMIRSSIGTI